MTADMVAMIYAYTAVGVGVILAAAGMGSAIGCTGKIRIVDRRLPSARPATPALHKDGTVSRRPLPQ